VRDGNNVNYDIDNLTNRYDSVGGNTLAYDAAGNLTKDRQGYTYQYDYENRITKIMKSGPTTVAEFTYDALGRRIKKVDSVGGTTSIYYYNDKWQVLSEYNGSNSPQRWFAYGNYIDEVLMMHTSTSVVYAKFYVHDHLFSPVALVQRYHLDLKERYEYDAYGNCQIMDISYNPRSSSLYGNPYYFTGRETDGLDNGDLKIMNYRRRYYDNYTGRFLTHDALDYEDGMNLYEYVSSNPTRATDPLGLAWTTLNFVEHYFGRGVIDGEWLWPGDPVDLERVGLLGAFRSASSVAAAVAGFKAMVPGVVSILRANVELACRRDTCGNSSADLAWSDEVITDVTLVPSLFAVGHSEFFRDGVCIGTADCACGMVSNWEYTCALKFSIRDAFKEPLDMEGVEIRGGVPYPINASWIENITWPVPVGPRL
jgi:RHS repeat-associated protein